MVGRGLSLFPGTVQTEVMCASYGLDPRMPGYREWRRGLEDLSKPDKLQAWAQLNGSKTIRPTGVRARNLNPIIRVGGMELAWWGFGPRGVPSKYPTINARSETLLSRATWREGYRTRRALIPATTWYEYQQPSKTRYGLGTGRLMMLAAVTGPATIEEGEVSCYSMVMQPAADHLAYIHDRSPLLIGEDLADDWLDPATIGDQQLVDAALAASEELLSEVTAVEA